MTPLPSPSDNNGRASSESPNQFSSERAFPSIPGRRASHVGKTARPQWQMWVAIALVLFLVVTSVVGVSLVWRNRFLAPDPGTPSGASATSGASVLDAIHGSGRQGAIPTVTVDGPLDVIDMKYRVVVDGEGRELTQGSPVVVAVTAFDGANGNVLTTDGRPVFHIGLAQSDTLGPELTSAVLGQHEGSRLLFVRRIANGQRAPGATSDIEIDVVDIMSSVADGEDVEPAQSGPISVTLSDEGPIASHHGDVPTTLTTQLLKKGNGPQVRTGDQVVAQFIVTGWNSGQVRTSTWNGGSPQLINLSTTMEGLKVALVDQRVGSRLAITIPPELAEGDDTLLAVVDILGTQPGGSDAQSGQVGTQSGDK